MRERAFPKRVPHAPCLLERNQRRFVATRVRRGSFVAILQIGIAPIPRKLKDLRLSSCQAGEKTHYFALPTVGQGGITKSLLAPSYS